MNKQLKAALVLSRTNTTSRFKLCALLKTKSGEVFTGFNNSDKTHPLCRMMTKGRMITTGIHAEINAITKANSRRVDLTGATLYVARTLRRDGSPALARPCPMCRRRIKQAGIRKVFYTIGPKEFGVLIND